MFEKTLLICSFDELKKVDHRVFTVRGCFPRKAVVLKKQKAQESKEKLPSLKCGKQNLDFDRPIEFLPPPGSRFPTLDRLVPIVQETKWPWLI